MEGVGEKTDNSVESLIVVTDFGGYLREVAWSFLLFNLQHHKKS